MNTEIMVFVLLVIVNLVLLYTLIQKKEPIDDNNFAINLNTFISTIDLYKESILKSNLESLKSKYDLNEKSQTNSIKAYISAKDELINTSVKDIFKNFISANCLKNLLKYYNTNGLTLLVITQLKR
ncbi:MAG: hypothetical protein WCZ11_02060 [Bacilli bacterium]